MPLRKLSAAEEAALMASVPLLISRIQLWRKVGYAEGLNPRETIDSQYVFVSLIVLVVSIAWFFLTSIWYKRTKPACRERVEKLFEDMLNNGMTQRDAQDHRGELAPAGGRSHAGGFRSSRESEGAL